MNEHAAPWGPRLDVQRWGDGHPTGPEGKGHLQTEWVLSTFGTGGLDAWAQARRNLGGAATSSWGPSQAGLGNR